MGESSADAAATFTAENVTNILRKTLEALQTPQNVKKLEEAKSNVGNEMLKMMQFLFPIVMQVEMEILKENGLASGKEGVIKFAQALHVFEKDDAEIGRLHSLVKAHYLPPVSVNTSSESPTE